MEAFLAYNNTKLWTFWTHGELQLIVEVLCWLNPSHQSTSSPECPYELVIQGASRLPVRAAITRCEPPPLPWIFSTLSSRSSMFRKVLVTSVSSSMLTSQAYRPSCLGDRCCSVRLPVLDSPSTCCVHCSETEYGPSLLLWFRITSVWLNLHLRPAWGVFEAVQGIVVLGSRALIIAEMIQ